MPINFDFGAGVLDYLVSLNGIDITDRIESGHESVGLLSGENKLVLVIKTTDTTETDVELADIVGCTVCIAKPKIVDETALLGTEYKVAKSGSNLFVNHDPSGRIFEVITRRAQGDPVTAIRVRLELVRGLHGESPRVYKAFIATGV
jgi:hypothetical protein